MNLPWAVLHKLEEPYGPCWVGASRGGRGSKPTREKASAIGQAAVGLPERTHGDRVHQCLKLALFPGGPEGEGARS